MSGRDMHPLNPTLLAHGQPGLDPIAPARGVVVALVLGGIAWMVICGLAWWAVWG